MFATVTVREVRDLQVTLGQQVGRLRPGDVALSAAPPMWEAYDRIERLAASAKLLLADRVEESRAWAREGDKNAADHLARKSGSSRGAARRRLATSKKLRKLPQTESALRRGELSQSQAEAIADAAANNPAAEQPLLETATNSSLAELHRHCGQAKAAGDRDRDATHRRLHQERRLHRYTDSEGAWNIYGRGTPETGALFNTIFDPIVEEIFHDARREGRREPHSAYEFDALIELAKRAEGTAGTTTAAGPFPTSAASAGTTTTTRGSASSAGSAASRSTTVPSGAGSSGTDTTAAGSTLGGQPDGLAGRDESAAATTLEPAAGHVDTRETAGPGATAGAEAAGSHTADTGTDAKRPSERYLALLRVDLEALVRGYTEGDELVEITGVGPVPVCVARELLGEATLKLVITKGVDVANVTHLGRGPTAAQRIAALWTSPFCENLGCPNTLQIQHDHREPWEQVQETTLGNLDRLCPRCHYLKTHKGWALVPGKGRRPLVPPDDTRHPNNTTRQPTTDTPDAAGTRMPTDTDTVAGADTPSVTGSGGVSSDAAAPTHSGDGGNQTDGSEPGGAADTPGRSSRPPPPRSLFDDAA